MTGSLPLRIDSFSYAPVLRTRSASCPALALPPSMLYPERARRPSMVSCFFPPPTVPAPPGLVWSGADTLGTELLARLLAAGDDSRVLLKLGDHCLDIRHAANCIRCWPPEPRRTGRSHSCAWLLAGLLHPIVELRFIGRGLLMDMLSAGVLGPRLARALPGPCLVCPGSKDH